MRYRLVVGLLPDNLTAHLVDLQRLLFREEGIATAMALPPFIPLVWTDAEAQHLKKILRRFPLKTEKIFPLTVTEWNDRKSGRGTYRVAASLKIEPRGEIAHLAAELKREVPSGPALFHAAEGVVLAIEPSGSGDTVGLSQRPVPRLTSRVLELTLLQLYVEDRAFRWELFTLSWLSGRKSRTESRGI